MDHAPPAAEIGHYENFPVASLLCPPHLRAPIAAIYHFARTADDIADEGSAESTARLHALGDYRVQLQLAANRDTSLEAFDPRWKLLFANLQHAIATHKLQVSLLNDLIDAFVQDVEKTRDAAGYASDNELLAYCARSANPVGRLLLHLYGVHDAVSLSQSDAICTALQLINFWQDPSVDIPRGRYYFTKEMMARSGVDASVVLARQQTPQVTRMIRQCAHSARVLMLQGAPLVHRVAGRAGWELRLVAQGGLRILEKIESMNFATLNARPRLYAWDYAVLLWRALWM
jgi:squalene synthase HpnC